MAGDVVMKQCRCIKHVRIFSVAADRRALPSLLLWKRDQTVNHLTSLRSYSIAQAFSTLHCFKVEPMEWPYVSQLERSR